METYKKEVVLDRPLFPTHLCHRLLRTNTHINRCIRECHQQIQDSFYEFEYHEGNIELTFQFDWSNFIKNESSISFVATAKYYNRFHAKCELERAIFPALDKVLTYIFLCANISTPGCFDLRNFSPTESKNIRLTAFNYSADDLYTAWCSNEHTELDLIKQVPLEEVIDWLNFANLFNAEIASSPMEVSIYSLLYYTRFGHSNFANIIWLFHCLESLYQTSSRNSLARRIVATTGVAREKTIKTMINEAYAVRNGFVHGGLKTPNPMSADRLIHSHLFDSTYSCINNILTLNLGTLQQMALNKWLGLDYQETFVPIPSYDNA
jgi:hypothetical protein